MQTEQSATTPNTEPSLIQDENTLVWIKNPAYNEPVETFEFSNAPPKAESTDVPDTKERLTSAEKREHARQVLRELGRNTLIVGRTLRETDPKTLARYPLYKLEEAVSTGVDGIKKNVDTSIENFKNSVASQYRGAVEALGDKLVDWSHTWQDRRDEAKQRKLARQAEVAAHADNITNYVASRWARRNTPQTVA